MRKILLLATLCGLLTACGTKGPLTLPQAKPAVSPATTQPAPQLTQPVPADDSTRPGTAK